MKKVRIALPGLIIALIMALFPLTGCDTGGGEAEIITPTAGSIYEELSQTELQQIYADSLANQAKLQSYKFDMDMDILADIAGTQPGKMNMLTKSSGSAQPASHQEQINMEMEINVEGMGSPGGTQSIYYDVYQMTDWVYMRIEMPGMGEQWMKMPMSDEIMEKFDIVNQQMDPLQSAVNIGLLGYANVDGAECYVLSVIPDKEALMDWISKQQGATQGFDWGSITDLSEVFKNLEYTYYITKDSRLPKRMVADMQMVLSAAQIGASSSDFDKMTMNITFDMTIFGYNEPFSIDLPGEAQNAMEVSENIFM